MFLCFITSRKEPYQDIHPSLLCLTGLAAIGTISLAVSLVIPLDLKVHIIFLAGALLWLLGKKARKDISSLCGRLLAGYSPWQQILLAACIAMVLVITVHPINHPDTIYYHARAILAFQRYSSIPGIANARVQMGFQSSWFATLAVFNPSIRHYNLLFLNGAILCWFLIFVIKGLQHSWLPWVLLAFTLASWTQIRLTAASGSPDFIVSIFCWAAILVFLDDSSALRGSNLVMAIVFCTADFLTKTAGILMLLLAAMALASIMRPLKTFIWCVMSGIVLCTRNFLASGYFLYPMSWPGFLYPRWKMPLLELQRLRDYIRGFATIPYIGPAAPRVLPWREKIGGWWGHISLPDQLLLSVIGIAVILYIVLFITRRMTLKLLAWNRYRAALFVVLTGSCAWLVAAPDPRFGTGPLVALAYLLYRPLLRKLNFVPGPQIFRWSAGCTTFVIAGYLFYRCLYFVEPRNLLAPSGIDQRAYGPIGCSDVQVDLLKDTIRLAQPSSQKCIDDYYGGFQPMGRTIREGFMPVAP
jgi:hypothetical protein